MLHQQPLTIIEIRGEILRGLDVVVVDNGAVQAVGFCVVVGVENIASLDVEIETRFA